jgi:inner membrane protein
MPTILTHPVPILALGLGLGADLVPGHLLVFAALCAVAPDLDVAGFRLHLASFAGIWGHRGATHSLVFACGLGAVAACLAPWLRCRAATAFVIAALAAISHIALDAMTDGGSGVAVFWPWDATRHFLPWRPIRVSPLSLGAFLTARGEAVLLSELRWVWLPCAAGACALRLARRKTP